MLTLYQKTQVTGTATAAVVASGTQSAGAGQVTNSGSSTALGGATLGTSSTSGSGSGSTSGASGSSSPSTKSPFSQAAIIAIAVIATIIAMLALFLVWRFMNRKKSWQAQNMAGVTIQPMNTTAQGSDVAYTTVPVYKAPQPRVGELSGNSAPGPVYETGIGQPTELDADNRKM